jgi:hypothetical protein
LRLLERTARSVRLEAWLLNVSGKPIALSDRPLGRSGFSLLQNGSIAHRRPWLPSWIADKFVLAPGQLWTRSTSLDLALVRPGDHSRFLFGYYMTMLAEFASDPYFEDLWVGAAWSHELVLV